MLWIGTSFKMTKTRSEAVAYARALRDGWTAEPSGVRPFVVPPATSLPEVTAALGPESPILAGAQNAHWAESGAWTGELSVGQVADAGARIVEIGHAERRRHFAETDETVHRKVRATLAHGLIPLVCVGEDAEVAAAGRSVEHVVAQAEAALAGCADASSVLLAYEPVWAIGEHGRLPKPADVAPVMAALHDRFGGDVEAVLYGGSVNLDNAAELLAVPGTGGLFVGRAAWQVEGLLGLLALADDHLRAGSGR
ncbi:triose-phosphate isomerase [Saccharopolyspora sp. NFXS83]|uniref:triose-phosphate isomerase n=1 Tax=Saccharopolyspora sp. NFXS83 TaxID=2993560 RepID=UPI00224B0A5B|nr:triose-phosphate isomerase [Saccharopolyspora sp. NFXS83]MCX2730723.1 triose-phosphate isomerase [Saccharopolyspora sp. NFXS83]